MSNGGIQQQALVVPYVKLTQSTSETCTTGVTKTITWDTADDAFGMFDGTSTLTIPNGWAGVWEVIAGTAFASSGAGNRRFIQIQSGALGSIAQGGIPPITGALSTVATLAVERLAVGDTLTAIAFQDSGGNLNIQNSGGLWYFKATFLHA